MENRIARIDALKRYISLLRGEEKRLSWVQSSPKISDEDRVDAGSNLRLITEKIYKADMELRNLEVLP